MRALRDGENYSIRESDFLPRFYLDLLSPHKIYTKRKHTKMPDKYDAGAADREAAGFHRRRI